MNFRRRLALFLIVTLVSVQVMTAISAYGFVRANLVEQGKRELAATTAVFMRQLNVLSERVSDGAQVLAQDYALRKAVAERDQATALSMLRNHGGRIGATRMLVTGLDGTIVTDTAQASWVGKPFPFGSLVEDAATNDQGTSLAVLDGAIYWIVVVPVRAPVPIAFVVACVPIDNVMLEKLRELSAFPQSLALATLRPTGAWFVASRTAGYSPSIKLPASNALPAAQMTVAQQQEDQHLAMTARVATAPESAPVLVVLDYPLDEALSAYRAVITPMLVVLSVALIIAVAGAMLIARGVSRPLELLATTARRIAKGDYTPSPAINRKDEVGQLANALDNMAHSIAEREAALKGAVASVELARNEAVKANEAKSQFLSNMSHELRTPLNAIIGFAEMIQQQILGPLGVPRYGEYARDINDAGKHLLVQVEEMLALSEAESGKLSIDRAPFKPGDALQTSYWALLPLAKKSGVKTALTGDPNAWPAIEGDADKLQQSFANIIHNAIKFTPPGGHVAVTAEKTDRMLRVIVNDTGIGIQPQDLAAVVRPFHRGRPAFDARHQGAGLGLPFAKTIVERHGGALRVDSTPGAGTTVIIELPLPAARVPFHDAA